MTVMEKLLLAFVLGMIVRDLELIRKALNGKNRK